jgi:hypothetical protein
MFVLLHESALLYFTFSFYIDFLYIILPFMLFKYRRIYTYTNKH